jgi:hypothetical protein
VEQQKANYLRNKLHEIEELKTNGQITQVRIQWKQKGAIVSKIFLTTIKMKPNKIWMLVLKDVGSKMVSKKENLEVQFDTISTTNYTKPKL